MLHQKHPIFYTSFIILLIKCLLKLIVNPLQIVTSKRFAQKFAENIVKICQVHKLRKTLQNKDRFEAVGLPYYNPHLFRNSIMKWGLKNLNQYEFKALSQNIGHEHAMTTYNSYAKLSEDEQMEAIFGIGQGCSNLQSISTENLLSEMAKRTRK